MKIRAGILFGGQSPEYEISLESAACVLSDFPDSCEPIPIGITQSGAWYHYTGPVSRIRDGTWQEDAACISPLLLPLDGTHTLRTQKEDLRPDVLFPVLHGSYCEDGRLQGALDTAGIPYVGCGVFAGAVGMDKITAKARLCEEGILSAPWMAVRDGDLSDPARTVPELERTLSYPIFVKPSSGGSSIGAGCAKNRVELIDCIQNAARWGTVLCEKFISGREIEIAILETEAGLAVSRPGEIRSGGEFYDFDTKYKTDRAKLCIPAELPSATAEICRTLATRIFRLLDCRGLARIDFFVTPGGGVLFNEINTMPGFTQSSMYPRLMKDAGFSLPRLTEALLTTACRPSVSA